VQSTPRLGGTCKSLAVYDLAWGHEGDDLLCVVRGKEGGREEREGVEW